MKRIILLSAIVFAAICSTTACSSHKEMSQATASSTVKRSYNLRGFSGIVNQVGIVVNYRQGSNWGITVEGSATLMERLDLRVSDGRLIIASKQPNKSWNGTLTMTLTAPRIETITNSGHLRFTTGDMTMGDFRLRNRGAMTFTAGTISCAGADISNSGQAATFYTLRAKGGVKLHNSGANKHEGDVQSAADIRLNNSGQDTFKGNLRGKSVETRNTGASTMKSTVSSDAFTFRNSGQTSASLTYKGGKADIVNSGSGTFRMDCDCTELLARNTGVAAMSLSGTADKTEIKASGVSKIDTKKLNKF